MDGLFHVVFSFIAGLAADLHRRHTFLGLLALAIIAEGIDLDHFFGMSTRGTFHNVFIVVLLPLAAFLVLLELEKNSSKMKEWVLIIMIMMIGHVTVDMFEGDPVKLFYPISDQGFTYSFSVDFFGTRPVSTPGILLSIYALILFLVIFVEDIVYYAQDRHESVKKAFRDSMNDLFWK
ncbi:MAG: metal-dependent hydrolase [Candidatus Micrarchaeota archaeon]